MTVVDIFYTLDLIGTGVFAASGAIAAGRKGLDLFGAAVIALVTAIGGGTIRDVLLGRHPLFWIADPAYLYVILLATALTILWTRFWRPPTGALLVADALGLALFTLLGINAAEAFTSSPVALVLMGTLTGSAGGATRDVLCNEVPLILQSGKLYATAAIAGASGYLALQHLGVAPSHAVYAGMLLVALLRFAALVLDLRLPVYQIDRGA